MMNSQLDPFYNIIRSRFEDPTGQGRTPVVLLMDSSKIRIMKSFDRAFQNQTFYEEKGGHFLTFSR